MPVYRNRWVAGALLVVAVLIFLWQASAREASVVEMVVGGGLFAVLLAAMLLFTDEPARGWLQSLASRSALSAYVPPLFACVLAVAYGLGVGAPGFLGILVPYCLVPVILAKLANRWGPVPNLWDALAILAIWFPVELGWVSGPPLPFRHGVMGFGSLLAMPVALYTFLAVRRVSGMGFRLDLRGSDLQWAVIYFLAFMPFALAIGLPTGFIAPSEHAPNVARAIGTLVAIFLFTGIPEEVLFRGLILNLLAQRLQERSRWKPVSLVVSSVIFGWAHVNNHVPPLAQWDLGPLGSLTVPWVYVLLATIAGVFYGLAYLKTGRVTAAALTHALVDAVWSLAFGG